MAPHSPTLFLNPLPIWFITRDARLDARSGFKTPAQQAAFLGIEPHSLTRQLDWRSRPSIVEDSVVREPLCGLAPTLNGGLVAVRLPTLCVPQFLGLRKAVRQSLLSELAWGLGGGIQVHEGISSAPQRHSSLRERSPPTPPHPRHLHQRQATLQSEQKWQDGRGGRSGSALPLGGTSCCSSLRCHLPRP